MPNEGGKEENVFGSADGSTYSAVLSQAGGQFTLQRLLIDGHNVPVPAARWATREEALDALKDYAQGNRRP